MAQAAAKKKREPVDLYRFEEEAYRDGFQLVCGVDEAGRGPLAGPVCAGAVILAREVRIEGLNDSKKLTQKKREALYEEIVARAASWSVAYATNEEIDRYNILQATFLAMRRAVEGLRIPPDLVLVDGNRDPGLSCEHTVTIVHGDALSASIAAASILAKVSRDRVMEKLAGEYPQYELEIHKGYPTKKHYERLREFGVSPIHRHSFLKKFFQDARAK
ncbi:MAG: ribonuclease HII [Provencibacterium sp.]|jgi:ribonuclease HII|nr:ribonuclease HII [Provencibacterium sp.]